MMISYFAKITKHTLKQQQKKTEFLRLWNLKPELIGKFICHFNRDFLTLEI